MRFVHDNLYPLFATLAITAAVIAWFAVPEPAQPKIQPPAAEQWELPQTTGHDSKKSIDAINARNLWGSVVVGAAAAKEPEWHILGIARNGIDRFVMLSVEGKPAEILRTGDALPDGLKIVEIENDRFFVLSANKKKIAFGIYKNDQAK